MSDHGCDLFEFKMNPAHASNFAGAWERQIRTVRLVLNTLLINCGSRFDDECLRTLLAEVAAIVNSRPLAVETLTDESLMPICPNQLLTMKSNILMPPPGKFEKEDLYVAKRWRRVQLLANQFWESWRKEYLQQLQSRQKWKRPQRNLSVGDIVLVSSDNSHRSELHLGRIKEVHTSEDGIVRSVVLILGCRNLDKKGKRHVAFQTLERPANKLVLLLESEENFTGDSPTGSL